MEQWEIDLLRRVAELERQVGDLVKPEVPRWVDWTPTVSQPGALTTTITYARYATFGKIAVVEAKIEVNSAGTAGAAIVVGGQPAAIQHGATNSPSSIIGSGFVVDATGSFYNAVVASVGATDWRFWGYTVTSYIGISPSFALANTDVIAFHAAYERA